MNVKYNKIDPTENISIVYRYSTNSEDQTLPISNFNTKNYLAVLLFREKLYRLTKKLIKFVAVLKQRLQKNQQDQLHNLNWPPTNKPVDATDPSNLLSLIGSYFYTRDKDQHGRSIGGEICKTARIVTRFRNKFYGHIPETSTSQFDEIEISDMEDHANNHSSAESSQDLWRYNLRMLKYNTDILKTEKTLEDISDSLSIVLIRLFNVVEDVPAKTTSIEFVTALGLVGEELNRYGTRLPDFSHLWEEFESLNFLLEKGKTESHPPNQKKGAENSERIFKGDSDSDTEEKPAAEVKDSRQWEEWAKKDEQQMKAAGASTSQNGSGLGKQNKNKKDKPVAMSVEEFSQAKLTKKVNHDSDSDTEDASERVSQPTPTAFIPQVEEDPYYFSRVEDDVKHIVKREQMQKDFQKQYEFENAQISKLQKDLELRQKEIVMLRTTTKKLEDELQQVKKRNQQLCHILAQGEMKDKTQLMLELEDLKQVRDESTEEVQRLTSDLEKERSKASQHTTTERGANKISQSGGGKHSTN